MAAGIRTLNVPGRIPILAISLSLSLSLSLFPHSLPTLKTDVEYFLGFFFGLSVKIYQATRRYPKRQ
jgi:hypothetical protein